MSKFFILGLIAAGVLGVACSQASVTATTTPATPTAPAITSTVTPTATSEPTLTPEAISAQSIAEAAVAAMLEVESVHVDMGALIKLSIDGRSLEIPVRLVGDYQSPDRARGILTIGLVLFEIEFEIIAVEDTLYFRHATSEDWFSFTGETPFFADPGEFIIPDLSTVADIELAGEVTLDGTPVYRLDGTTSADTFGVLTGEFEGSFWVGVEDSRLRQIVVRGQVDLAEDDPFLAEVASGGASVVLTLKLSDFDVPPSIEAPEITPTPSASVSDGPTDNIEAVRTLAFDYWEAFNAYDADVALSFLEDRYRSDRESEIRMDIGRIKRFRVKLGVSEQDPPQMIRPTEAEMFLKMKEPIGTRRIRMAFLNVDGVWKITFAEQVK